MGVVSIKLCRSRSYHEIKMSNASDTYPLQASAIKKGAHAVMKGHPCKVIETSTSKTGKHGHAKDDLKLPEGQLGDDIRAAFDDGKEVLVTVVAAMGNEQIMTSRPTLKPAVHGGAGNGSASVE